MNLQTKIPLGQQSENLIDYNSNVLLLGSCFSDNIGKKLEYFKFQNFQNPFGILFHPKAIEALIENAINGKEYTESDIFSHNERWHCFEAHSNLSSASKDELLTNLNTKIRLTASKIKETSHIIITLGTAWSYRFLETGKTVANCHKVPQNQFAKALLSVDEISASLKSILGSIRSVNYGANVIFTVSPVRHLKDGFVENTRSKSHLITAIHQVVENTSFYFPSYEIMIDELRDYRFYTEDMVHPNQTAINYIWEKFQQVWVSSKALKIMDEVNEIQKGLQHKPFNPSSSAHTQFIQKLEAKKINLQAQFPHIVF